MVSVEDASHILAHLESHGIRVWIVGGWGIDALLEEHTRPHKDLDLLMLVDDVARMRDLLAREGYRQEELWSENRWVVDASGAELPTAFVLQDSQGRQIDAHALRLDDQGSGIPAWDVEDGFIFRSGDLAGAGSIAGFPVRCITPSMQVVCHSGYAMPEVQIQDMALLQERYGAGGQAGARPWAAHCRKAAEQV